MSRSLRKVIEQSPAGTQFTREGLLAAWDTQAEQIVRWVGIAEAAEIADIPAPTLRASAVRWASMQEDGKDPPVRVRRKGNSDRSPWLFDEGDCWAYRRKNGGGPRSVPQPSAAVDDDSAVIEHYARKVTANL